MEIVEKRSQIVIEFTSDEVNALKHILNTSNTPDYQKFRKELYELIS